ncbi:MAG: hypothetical protein Q7K65_00250 [Candidatus Buchananbacteria bacterium]|nr:hypothetical protein [Candidatus Buchananbacteria bacterium]
MNFENKSEVDEEKMTAAEELALFNERIEQFVEEDLNKDDDGSWNKFEQKIRDVFPELSEDRFKAIKAAVSMHLCGL